MATIIHVDGTLKLAVLWRGAPRWYLGSGSRKRIWRRQGTTYWVREQFGDVGIDMSFDTARDILTLGRSSVNVPHGANVLLVDGVGSAAGPQLAGIPHGGRRVGQHESDARKPGTVPRDIARGPRLPALR